MLLLTIRSSNQSAATLILVDDARQQAEIEDAPGRPGDEPGDPNTHDLRDPTAAAEGRHGAERSIRERGQRTGPRSGPGCCAPGLSPRETRTGRAAARRRACRPWRRRAGSARCRPLPRHRPDPAREGDRSTTIRPRSSATGSERTSGDGALPIAAMIVSASIDWPSSVLMPVAVAASTPVSRRISMPRRRS